MFLHLKLIIYNNDITNKNCNSIYHGSYYVYNLLKNSKYNVLKMCSLTKTTLKTSYRHFLSRLKRSGMFEAFSDFLCLFAIKM